MKRRKKDTMAYDMTRCPQTESEFTDYFYSLIGRSLNATANDWAAVMSAPYPWNGQSMVIPEGVGPGVKQPADAPFFGLTQQWSGGPKARIFLPTSQPDELGYYTRCIQYLADAQGGGFLWTWYWVAGHEYTPVTGVGTQPPPGITPPPVEPPSGDMACINLAPYLDPLREAITALDRQLAELTKRVDEMGTGGGGALPKKIALVSDHGKYLTAESDGNVTNRETQAAAWQHWRPEVIEP